MTFSSCPSSTTGASANAASTDFPIQKILDHLVKRIVDERPDTLWAGRRLDALGELGEALVVVDVEVLERLVQAFGRPVERDDAHAFLGTAEIARDRDRRVGRARRSEDGDRL